jgi:hypothetical protein
MNGRVSFARVLPLVRSRVELTSGCEGRFKGSSNAGDLDRRDHGRVLVLGRLIGFVPSAGCGP